LSRENLDLMALLSISIIFNLLKKIKVVNYNRKIWEFRILSFSEDNLKASSSSVAMKRENSEHSF
jgi:hypothetical protein